MKKLYWITLCFLFLGVGLQAQTLKAYEKAAEKAVELKDYYAALVYYEVVLEATNNRLDIFYDYADAARQFNALTLSEEYYEKVYNSNHKHRFPDTDYLLGTVKRKLGKYEEAKKLFQDYINQGGENEEYLAEAKRAIMECNWANEVLAEPKEGYGINILGDEVNSNFSEFAPIIVGDTLFYSSLRFPNAADEHEPPRQVSKLMFQTRNKAGETLDRINYPEVLTGHSSLNEAGNRLFYTICMYSKTGDIPCRIYVSEKDNDGTWKKGVELPESINQMLYTSTHPNVGQDKNGKEVLYFVSNRMGGKGGLDIWSSTINGGNSYGAPINLTEVNTSKDDVTPFWHRFSNTLYFSSEGYQTLGGFDIYKSEVINNVFEQPSHMGTPLNTSYDDLYYSLNLMGTKGYLSSNREGSRYIEKSKSACCNDIFSVDIAPLQLAVKVLLFDAETKAPINGSTINFIQQPDELLFSRINKVGNDFLFEVDKEAAYIFKANHPEYESDTIMVSTIGWKNQDEIVREIYLKRKPIITYSPLNLQALIFDVSTKLPLLGATVELLDDTDKTRVDQLNSIGNDFEFDIMGGHIYTIKVTRPDYEDAILTFTAEDINDEYTFVKKFYLTPLPIGPVDKELLASYLPLPIYFDNDSPNPRSRSTTTNVNYQDLVSTYMYKKGEFNSFYTRGLNGIAKVEAENTIVDFFDHEVNRGTNALKGFTQRLLIYMEEGNRAEIRIKGYASPRAEADYNLRLTKRRIQSVINYLRTYKNGALIPYVNNGQLILSQQPFGEVLAPEDVSDDINDLRNSIYSISASKERRVEIVEIK